MNNSFQPFLDWLAVNGATYNNLNIVKYDESNRGVHAGIAIKEKEEIFYIPKNLMITLQIAKETPIGSLIHEKSVEKRLVSPIHDLLSVFLL